MRWLLANFGWEISFAVLLAVSVYLIFRDW